MGLRLGIFGDSCIIALDIGYYAETLRITPPFGILHRKPPYKAQFAHLLHNNLINFILALVGDSRV